MAAERRNLRIMNRKPTKWIIDYNREHIRRKVVFYSTDIGNESDVADPFLSMAQTTKKLGHDVIVVTTHCEDRIIENEFKFVKVLKMGEMIPKSICGTFYRPLYFLRSLYLFFWFLKKKNEINPTFVVVEGPNAIIPLLKRFGKFRIVQIEKFGELEFLLAHSQQPSVYKGKMFQKICIQHADEIVVQNLLSRVVLMKLFPDENKTPAVLYPCIDTSAFERCGVARIRPLLRIPEHATFFVSFGPLRRSSNFELIIKAFAMLSNEARTGDPTLYHNMYLIIAGYYEDTEEYIQYTNEIQFIALKLCYKTQAVLFLNGTPMIYRKTLLNKCIGVLHPMLNSLDGRPILEANMMKKPILACDSGIAIELIENGVNGFILKSQAIIFARCMNALIFNRHQELQREEKMYTHFKKNYSMIKYCRHLQDIIDRNSRHVDYPENQS